MYANVFSNLVANGLGATIVTLFKYLYQRKLLLGVCALILIIGIWLGLRFGVPRMVQVQFFPWTLPLNEQLLNKSWAAFEQGRYDEAIASAERVIDEFADIAVQQQRQLQDQQEPLPPVGAVSRSEKDKIFARGLLNDVASSYWIIGRSQAALGRDCEAEQAYQAVSQLTYARTWDTKGWFWSPSQDAQSRLVRLSC